MNGASLLLVLATVGVTAKVELDPAGQPVYSIRIESVLVQQLREGEEIEANVAPRDRQVRRFRVLVTPESPSRSAGFQTAPASDSTARSESLVEYEPVLMDNNDIEMWVQLAPERLETLAKGKPIEGELAPEWPEIDRYRIFVGVNRLPRQQQAQQQAANGQAPYLLPNGDPGLAPAGASEPDPRNTGSTTRTPQYQSTGTTGTTRPYQNDGYRTALRNGPDQTSMAPPPGDRYAQQQGATSNQPLAPGFTNNTNSRFNEPYAPTGYQDRNSAAQYSNSVPPAQQQMQPQNPNMAPPMYSQPQQQFAARQDNSLAAAPAVNGWNQTVANNQPIASPQPAVSTPAPVAEKVEVARSSTPLILTTLALFTSLGVNTYLGWLAWSFFWRYRDAVNDSARARSYNAPNRQAA